MAKSYEYPIQQTGSWITGLKCARSSNATIGDNKCHRSVPVVSGVLGLEIFPHFYNYSTYYYAVSLWVFIVLFFLGSMTLWGSNQNQKISARVMVVKMELTTRLVTRHEIHCSFSSKPATFADRDRPKHNWSEFRCTFCLGPRTFVQRLAT